MINFDYNRPSTQKGALDLLKDKTAKFIAGGTNLVDLMKRGVMAPDKVVDITALPLREITQNAGGIRIGALALNSTVAENALVKSKLPLLSEAFNAGASAQIRNMATVGGNLLQRTRCPYFYDTAMPCNKRQPGTGCGALKGYNRMHAIFGASEQCIAVHPSDMAVALAALDASVLVSSNGGDRMIPILDFHRLPGTTPQTDTNLSREELITSVQIPVPPAGAFRYLKIRDRASYAFALVSVAAQLPLSNGKFHGVRLAMGGVAHKPWRLKPVEALLEGQAPSAGLYRQAAELAVKDARGYGQNNFKIGMARNAVIEALNTVPAS